MKTRILLFMAAFLAGGCGLKLGGEFQPDVAPPDLQQDDSLEIDIQVDDVSDVPDGDGEPPGEVQEDPDLDDGQAGDDAGDGLDAPDQEVECTTSEQCDNLEACDGGETCSPEGVCEPGTPLPDGTPCITSGGEDGTCRGELCAPEGCGNDIVESGEECDDGNIVNEDGCESNCLFSCHGGDDCDDVNDCTADTCGEVTDGWMCQYEFLTGPCSDLDPCTHADTCDGAGSCVGTPYTCTLGTCEASSRCDGAGGCTIVYSPSGTRCSDGLYCTTMDTCNGSGLCIGTGNACVDTRTCTEDLCTEGSGTAVCSNPVRAGFCLISGSCYGDGSVSPASACLWCQSGSSQTAWTDMPYGTSCTDGLFCTLTDVCDGLGACAGTGNTCDDGKSCTNDNCNETADSCSHPIATGWCQIGGSCYPDGGLNPLNECQQCLAAVSNSSWTPVLPGTTCDDGQFCTLTDACNISGACIGAGARCSDGIACTSDTCNESTDSCSYPLQAGWCLIDGICYVDGESNPSNECLECIVTRDPFDWSYVASGTPCNDGQFCTATDTCSGSGACYGSGAQCNDSYVCTADTCNESTDTCSYPVQAGRCLIAGTCCISGEDNPLNACQECNTSLSQTAWSPVTGGTPCNDGLFCTGTDACNGSGACTGAGNPCNDFMSCTANDCNEAADSCSFPIQAGWCLIGGACYADGEANPSNVCQMCNTSLSQIAWSPAPSTTFCDDGLHCTTTDRCNGAGACAGTGNPCNDGLVCTDNVCTEAGSTFLCSYPIRAGYCLIGGLCYTTGQDNPINDCQECVPLSSPVAWTNKGAGSVCTADAYSCTVDTCDGLGYCNSVPTDAQCPVIGQLCRPQCFASSTTGCGFIPFSFDLACSSPVTIPPAGNADSNCTVSLGGMTGQQPCLSCSSEVGLVAVDFSDFGEAEGGCGLDGWTLDATPDCCDNMTSCAISSCAQDCCTDLGEVCQESSGRYYLRTPKQQCGREEWHLVKTYNLSGLHDVSICLDIADNNANGTDEGILAYVSDAAHPTPVQVLCQAGEPQPGIGGVYYTYCGSFPSWTSNNSSVTITIQGHAESNWEYLYLDDITLRGWVQGCATPAALRAFSENFTGCPNPITSGWNGWTVSGAPDCPGAWSCASAAPSAQAVDESWTIEHAVDTSSLDGGVELCFSLGDRNGGTSFDAQFDAGKGAGWQTAWRQTGNLGPDDQCRQVCVNLSDINSDVARNTALWIRFVVDSSVTGTGYYTLDGIEVRGYRYCSGTGIVGLGPISDAGGGNYNFYARDLPRTPMSPLIECSWDTPPLPVGDWTPVNYRY